MASSGTKPGANQGARAKPKAKTGGKPLPGIERGDHVYVQHPKRGAMAVRVLATGRDGFTGECDRGKRHGLEWPAYLGHKARLLQRYGVVDQGADGALLEDEHGRRRYLAGEVPAASETTAGHNDRTSPQVRSDDGKPSDPGAEPSGPATPSDDPLTGGLGRLTKAIAMQLPAGTALFLKAVGAVANRPGLALKRVTDKAGHATQRWTRTNPDQPTGRRTGLGEPVSGGGASGLAVSPKDRLPRSDPKAERPRVDPGKDGGLGRPGPTATRDAPKNATGLRADPKDRLRTSDPDAKPGEAPGAKPAASPRPPVTREQIARERAESGQAFQASRQRMQDATNAAMRGKAPDAPKPAAKPAGQAAAMEDAPELREDKQAPALRGRGQYGGGEDRSSMMTPEQAAAAHRADAFRGKAPDAPRPGQHTPPTPREAEKPTPTEGAAPIRHGDQVNYRHGDVQGSGKVVASGADGVTVHDGKREHQVRHEHLEGRADRAPSRPDYAARNDGEDDKAYLKRTADQLPDPDHLPEDHDKYFNHVEGGQTVPMDQLVSTKSDEENAKGGNNSPKFMAAAYHGQVAKRDPITVKKRPDGKYDVMDGNGTFTGAKKHGWKTLPVRVEGGAGAGESGDAAAKPAPGGTAPLFDKAEVDHLPPKAKQPFTTQEELYGASTAALTHLKGWLDQGKGVCSRMGYQTMTCSPEDADMTKPGGMLFIAPLKGQKRAAEKVEADYGGDWSLLKDSVRCSIAVDTMDDISDALEQLKKSGMILAQQPKDRFAKPLPEGYRDLMMNVKFPNGLIGEVQIHLKSMLVAKSEGHKPYETMRSIDAKPREQWTDEDKASWQAAFDQSKQIYGSAWAKAGAATGAPDETKKPAQADLFAKSLLSTAAKLEGWEFYDREGAIFRRPAGQPGGVTDVLHGKTWKPYTGDRTEAYLRGDRIADPLGSGGGDLAKGGPPGPILFLKASIPGGALGDLFAQPVNVAGHVHNGKFVGPYVAVRHKAGEAPPAAMHHLAATPASTPHIARPVEPPPARRELPAKLQTEAAAVAAKRDAQLRELAAIKDRNTAYEAVLVKPDGTKVLLCYTGRKSVAGLVDAVQKRGQLAAAYLNLADDARMKAGKGELTFDGGGKVLFTGRTQRDGIMEGHLPTVREALDMQRQGAAARAIELAAMTPAARSPGLPLPQKPIEQVQAEQLAAYEASKVAAAPKPVVPPEVVAKVQAAVNALHSLHAELQTQRRAGSGPEWWTEHGGGRAVQHHQGVLDKFRAAATRMGLDGGEAINAVGGVPDFADMSPIMPERPAHHRDLPVEMTTPGHVQEMRDKLARISGRRYNTASDERAAKLYTERLAADPAKWKQGQGVRWAVMAHGGVDQWNRGYQVVDVHPADLQATIRPVADTGLTTTGGNRDRLGEERVYLGDLRRDKKYDAP